jgi:hypothetical protein
MLCDFSRRKLEHLEQSLSDWEYCDLTEELDCSDNSLRENSFASLRKLPKLHSLILTRNPFSFSSFLPLPNLRTLVLRNCSLCGELDMSGVPNLSLLDLSENGLQNVPSGVFQMLSLNTLMLNKNNLREVLSGMRNLTQLINLSLADNPKLWHAWLPHKAQFRTVKLANTVIGANVKFMARFVNQRAEIVERCLCLFAVLRMCHHDLPFPRVPKVVLFLFSCVPPVMFCFVRRFLLFRPKDIIMLLARMIYVEEWTELKCRIAKEVLINPPNTYASVTSILNNMVH